MSARDGAPSVIYGPTRIRMCANKAAAALATLSLVLGAASVRAQGGRIWAQRRPAQVVFGLGRQRQAMSPYGAYRASDGVAIFTRMLQAEDSLTSDGQAVTVREQQDGTVTSTEHIVKSGYNGTRIEYTSPAGMVGTVIVDNGVTYWQYKPHRGLPGVHPEIQTGPSRIAKQRQRLQQMMRNARRGNLIVSIVGADNIAGRSCTTISVQRRGDPGPMRMFCVDDATGAQLKSEQAPQPGVAGSMTYYTQVQFNVPVSPDAFSPPSIPNDAAVTPIPAPGQGIDLGQAQQLAGFPPLQPAYVPEGYRFQSAEVNNFGTRKMIWQRYSNGLNTFSVFQTPAVMKQAPVRWPKPDTVTTIVDGYRVVVIGNLPHPDMMRVLTSLR